MIKGRSDDTMVGYGSTVRIETLNDRLTFEKETGRLISFRAKTADDQEFITIDNSDPAFIIQYLDDNRRFRQIYSDSSREIINDIDFDEDTSNGKRLVLTFRFKRPGDAEIYVKVRIMASTAERFVRWQISVDNRSGLLITDVQFPFLTVPYELNGRHGSETLVRPFFSGELIKAPKPQDLEPDSPHAWQFHPENGCTSHYPGHTFAQFLAYYNDKAGIYLSCTDISGFVKQIKPVHHGSGIRLGVSHAGDWPQYGLRKLEYEILTGSFSGDWYDAAELYRNWSLEQQWAKKPLKDRTDVPEWLLDSPPHIMIRIKGQLDEGPAEPNNQFLPYIKTISLLEKISNGIKSPLVPVIMSWERPGPWVYPDCFPPVGGEQSLCEFTAAAGERGWHAGSFCNGTRWVTGNYWSSYDGEDYFSLNGGENCTCRTHRQELWRENWDSAWRPSHPCCIYTEMTHRIALDFAEKLMDMGLDWIQFLDQNVGCSTFPCYSDSHGHTPVPARWMTEKMKVLLSEFIDLALRKRQDGDHERKFVFSVESAPNEYFMPYFQVCDVRVIPENHTGKLGIRNFIPLYHYLYHEFILMQGGFGSAPEPYHLQIKNAYNLVVGEIPGGVLTGNGTLLNRDTLNWAPWNPTIGCDADSLEMLRTATALRRGRGRDFLVYGRMQRPSEINDIDIVRWQENGNDNCIPAIFHSAWTLSDGRLGIVLANWTTEERKVILNDSRLSEEVLVSNYSKNVETYLLRMKGNTLMLNILPLSCLLLEGKMDYR